MGILVLILVNSPIILIIPVAIIIVKHLVKFRLQIESEQYEDVIDDDDDDDDDDNDDDDDEDDDDDDDEEEDEESDSIPVETKTPRVSSSVADGGKKELNFGEFDVCGICWEAWDSNGDHQICCLSCGHIYGMSCIKNWLQGHKRCPQCNISCTLKDVRVLYATRLRVTGQTLHKFPLTEEGFRALKQLIDASEHTGRVQPIIVH